MTGNVRLYLTCGNVLSAPFPAGLGRLRAVRCLADGRREDRLDLPQRRLVIVGHEMPVDVQGERSAVVAGRPPAMTAEQIRHARDLLTRPDNTVSSIARLLGVSRATIYKYVPELPARARPAEALPPGGGNARERRPDRVGQLGWGAAASHGYSTPARPGPLPRVTTGVLATSIALGATVIWELRGTMWRVARG